MSGLPPQNDLIRTLFKESQGYVDTKDGRLLSAETTTVRPAINSDKFFTMPIPTVVPIDLSGDTTWTASRGVRQFSTAYNWIVRYEDIPLVSVGDSSEWVYRGPTDVSGQRGFRQIRTGTNILTNIILPRPYDGMSSAYEITIKNNGRGLTTDQYILNRDAGMVKLYLTGGATPGTVTASFWRYEGTTLGSRSADIYDNSANILTSMITLGSGDYFSSIQASKPANKYADNPRLDICMPEGGPGYKNTQIPQVTILGNKDGGYVGIGTTVPEHKLTIQKDISYGSISVNPLNAQINIKGETSTSRLLIGNYYTSNGGTASAIQSSDYFADISGGAKSDHSSGIFLNPLGGLFSTVQINAKAIIDGTTTLGNAALDVSGITTLRGNTTVPTGKVFVGQPSGDFASTSDEGLFVTKNTGFANLYLYDTSNNKASLRAVACANPAINANMIQSGRTIPGNDGYPLSIGKLRSNAVTTLIDVSEQKMIVGSLALPRVTTAKDSSLTVVKDIEYSNIINPLTNPLPGHITLCANSNTKTNRLILGSYYSSGSTLGAIQASDYYPDPSGNFKDNGASFLINPLGGYVGVGTNNPQETLDVNGTIKASRIQITDAAFTGATDAEPGLFWKPADSDGNTGISVNGQNSLVLTTNGKINQANNTDTTLNFAKTTFNDSTGTQAFYILRNSSGNFIESDKTIKVSTFNEQKTSMVIDNANSRVGIGSDSAPQATLDVRGSISIGEVTTFKKHITSTNVIDVGGTNGFRITNTDLCNVAAGINASHTLYWYVLNSNNVYRFGGTSNLHVIGTTIKGFVTSFGNPAFVKETDDTIKIGSMNAGDKIYIIDECNIFLKP